MRARSFFFLLCCALAAASARAEIEVGFAVPDEGRVTLGVFDTSGHLVRVLHSLSAQEDFRTGLNGLITAWDGTNDAGDPLPSGRYHIRGYLIGNEVSVAGEEFLFNDFAGDSGFPDLNHIHGFSLLKNGDVLLLGGTVNGGAVLARFSDAGGFGWSNPKVMASSAQSPAATPTASFPPLLAANESAALLIAPNLCNTFSLENGELVACLHSTIEAPPLAAAGNASSWFVSSVDSVTALPAQGDENTPAEAGISAPPAAFTALDADASILLGATPDGVWIHRETWKSWAGPVGANSLSLGTPGTFWFVGTVGDSSFVGQATFEGEILRAMEPDPGGPKPEQIRASRAADAFLVLEASPGLQRLRAMTRSAGGNWEIDWERTIRDSARFGFADGEPVPDAGEAEPLREIRIHMQENPLNGRRDFLLVRAGFDKSGSGLFSPDGLPLVHVSNRPEIRRVAIHRGTSPDSVIFLQGNGAFVERFSIQGLSDILPIDAGDIELP